MMKNTPQELAESIVVEWASKHTQLCPSSAPLLELIGLISEQLAARECALDEHPEPKDFRYSRFNEALRRRGQAHYDIPPAERPALD